MFVLFCCSHIAVMPVNQSVSQSASPSVISNIPIGLCIRNMHPGHVQYVLLRTISGDLIHPVYFSSVAACPVLSCPGNFPASLGDALLIRECPTHRVL